MMSIMGAMRRIPPVRMAAPVNFRRFLRVLDRRLLVAFCVVHPINPACCPTPCPVIDMSKVASFVEEADQAWQKVDQCRQMADRYLTLASTFGPSGSLVTELRRVPGAVSGAFATFQASYPSILTAGDLGNPRAASEILKTAFFDASTVDGVKLSDSVDHVRQRTKAAAAEAMNALATGMHGYRRLTDIAADRARQTANAGIAATARDDLAVNASARQALVDSLGGMKELLSSWAATEASFSAMKRTVAADPLPSSVSPAAASTSSLAVSLRAEAARIEQLRQVRSSINQLDTVTSAMTGLHNERHAAAVMLAQYPGLWNTVASDNKAIEFRTADEAATAAQLGQIFTDGAVAFQEVRRRLLALDNTTWRDNETKTAAAMSAAQSVALDVLSNPHAYGTPRADLGADGRAVLSSQYDQTLANGFAAWLEDDKQERFWAPLRRDAETAIASLDTRLKAINDRRGYDISGPSAVADETGLLDQFAQRLRETQALVSSTGQTLGDAQRGWIGAYISAFQDAATAIRSDGAASAFVTVRWPS